MKDPVVVKGSGHTYERKAIEHWFKLGHKTDPVTGKEIIDPEFIPNLTLKSQIELYKSEKSNLAEYVTLMEGHLKRLIN
jgi:hypothetical protein